MATNQIAIPEGSEGWKCRMHSYARFLLMTTSNSEIGTEVEKIEIDQGVEAADDLRAFLNYQRAEMKAGKKLVEHTPSPARADADRIRSENRAKDKAASDRVRHLEQQKINEELGIS